MMVSPSIPNPPFNTSHGSLGPLMSNVQRFYNYFWATYDKRKWETGYRDDLPLVKRAARLSFVECDEIITIISWPSHMTGPTGRHGHTYPKDQYPDLAGVGDVNEIAKSLYLGEVIAYRPFPLQHDHIEAVRVNAAEGREESSREAAVLVKEAAENWARELADEHMARTHPDFEAAKQRMTSAYAKLFELEHYLRLFVEQALEAHYGSDWWDKAKIPVEVKDDVTAKQADTRGWWLDEFDTSVLRFTDFGQLRQIISQNKGRFLHVTGNSTWFTQTLSALEPLRNRIGHMNVLSADNEHDFYRDANRIVAAIRPHIQQEPAP